MKRTKVLIVEDDKLLSTTLHLFVSELDYELVGISESGENAVKQAKEHKPDIVLMDIHLPGEIDGIIAAQEIFTKFGIPVIYVTSDNNEETVRRALATNSYGYLIKPVSKVTLGISIEQALLKQKHEIEITSRENRYRTLVEDSPDAVVVINENAVIEYINFTGLKLFGTIHIEEVLERSIYDFFQEKPTGILENRISKAFESHERIDYFPLEFKSLKGREFLVGVVGSVINFNKKISIQLIISDHTEKIRTKTIIQEQQSIINTINDGIIALDKDGNVTLWNNGAEKIFGIDVKNAIGQNISFIFNELPDFFESKFLRPVINEVRSEFEYKTINKKTDQPVHVRISLSSMKSDEMLSGVICYCCDITNRADHEVQLKRFNADYKAIFNGGSEAMIIVSNEYTIVDYNKLAKQYADNLIKKELVLRESVIGFMFFLNRSEIRSLLENAFEGVAHYLERLVTFSNVSKYLKINIFPIFNSDETIDRLCISLLDITDRKKIEKALDETRNELKPMFDSSIQRFYLIDLNYNLLAFNKSAQDTIQRDMNHTLRRGDYIVDFIPPEMSPEQFKEHFEQAKKGNLVVFKQKLKVNGGFEFNEAHLEPIINDKGEIYRILLWTLDVTDSEKNMIALKESEERYALVAKGGNDGLWDWDMEKMRCIYLQDGNLF